MGLCLVVWGGPGMTQAVTNSVTVGGTDYSASYVDPVTGRIDITNDTAPIGITVDSAIGSTATPYGGRGVVAWSTQPVTVDATADVTSTDTAIWVDSSSNAQAPGDVNITSAGNVSSRDVYGIGVVDVYGSLTLNGAGTGTVAGGTEGIAIFGGSPDVTINDFTSVIGGRTSIYIDSNDGDASIQGIGQIGDSASTEDGIYADVTNGGNLDIGGTSAIGSITGGDDGVEAYTNGTGTMTIAVGDVTGADAGIYARTEAGDLSISATGDIVADGWGAIDAIATTTGNVDINGNGTATATGDDFGFWAETNGGDMNLEGFGTVTATGTAVIGFSGGGDLTISDMGNVGGLTSDTGDGIYADGEGGNVSLTNLGTISAGDDGVEAYTNGTGTMTIAAGDVTGADAGIYTRTDAGDLSISATGDIVADGWGAIDAIATTTGNVDINGNGTATATGDDFGFWAETNGGDMNLEGFGTVTATGTAVIGFSGGGDLTISDMGNVGGLTSDTGDGIYADGEGGNVSLTNLGTISAGDGAGIESYTNGTGTMTIEAGSNITGSDYGIYSRSEDGAMDITIASDVAVTGTATTGIDAAATGTGTTSITVDSGATVEGGGWGLVTGGAASVVNSGIIRTIGDTGEATDTGLGDALWSWTGTTSVSNDGDILGQIHSDDIGLSLANNAGGTWVAGTGDNTFDGLSDEIQNAGTILIRDGATTFVGLETFNTLSGGVVDLTYGAAATDSLTVLNLSSAAGAAYSFDFDATAANNSGTGFDNSENSLGTADTIVVDGTATPEAGTLVNVNSLAGDPTALTGSVSLIYTGTDLAAPDAGANIVASSFYSFGTTNAADAATAYYLVDDGAGGVYLQWAPNLTTATMGGYSGGDLSGAGTEGGTATAAAGFAWAGPLGAMDKGVSGSVADAAAASARHPVADCEGNKTRIWGELDGARLSGSGISGHSAGINVGVDQDLSELANTECGRLVGGAFIGVGRSTASWSTGNSSSDNKQAGVYLRYTAPSGFYTSAVGTYGWSDTDLANAVFASTATQKSHGWSAVLNAGQIFSLGAKDHLDLRAFAGHARSTGDGFTDSAGIVVDGTKARMTTLGISLGYQHDISPDWQAEVRGGAKWSDVTRDTTAFGVTSSGSVNAPSYTLSAAINGRVDENTNLKVGVAGEFGDGVRSLGGSLHLEFRF